MAMQILKKMRKEAAVYWPREGLDDDGDPTYGEPVEVLVRWEDVNEVIRRPNGEEVISRSRVYVGEDMKTQDVLFRGSLAEVGDETDPFANEGAHEIQKFDNIPTLKYDDRLRVAWL